MRSSYARASALSLSLLVAAALSCAPKAPPAATPEPLVSIEGTVSLAGDDPVDRELVLSDEGGTIAALRGGAIEIELRALAGMGVRVAGRLAPRAGAEPEFLVEGYEILPIDGATPIVGVIGERAGIPGLVDARGASYLLDGPLARALVAFAGYKAWVAGKVSSAEATGGRAIDGTSPARCTVENYGLLLPPPPTDRAR